MGAKKAGRPNALGSISFQPSLAARSTDSLELPPPIHRACLLDGRRLQALARDGGPEPPRPVHGLALPQLVKELGVLREPLLRLRQRVAEQRVGRREEVSPSADDIHPPVRQA